MMVDVGQSCTVGDGVLIVKKETGWTSHDVVAKVRQVLGGAKVGHAGTLDPAATGVLPVLIGRATRIAEYLVEWDKEYVAVLRLGEATDTQDATGTVLARHLIEGITPDAIHAAVARFRGRIEQVPPMYSAVKIDGMPLYKSARAGKTIAREARSVMIHALEIVTMAERDITLRVVCSKGTYIRTLCADIGEALGVGGHMLSLERTRVGPLTIDQALTVEEVTMRYTLGRLGEQLVSLDQALDRLPVAVVDEPTAERVRHGVPVPAEKIVRWELGQDVEPPAGKPVRIQDLQGQLIAIGQSPGQVPGAIRIDKVLSKQDQ
jgi:tRNA pseudouridine55 synthase